MKKAIFISILLAALASPAAGQILKETKTQSIKTAAQMGKLAGAGYFCGVDSDALDDLITIAYARIAIQAIDKVDRVVAQLEFSNNYSASSAKAPDEGCEAFQKNFSEKIYTFIQQNKGPIGP